MLRFRILLVLFLPALLFADWQVQNTKLIYLTGVEYNFQLQSSTGTDSLSNVYVVSENTSTEKLELTFSDNTYKASNFNFKNSGTYQIQNEQQEILAEIRVLPGWISLLPPMAAIILALITRQVLLALFAGIWLGAFFIYDLNPFKSFLFTLTDYVAKAPADLDHMSILIFSLSLGGMVGVMSRSGGTQGIVQKLAKYASNSRRGQFVTWLMGVLIFFDDYANTLIVGNTMRPLTDKLKISREKLAYLVDSTAAPVANIAIISTWIGYEISLINNAFESIGIHDNAYITFFKTIPYNAYPLFALAFGLMIALSGRDLFAMFRAEKRAANENQLLREGAMPLADLNGGELQTKEGVPLRWYNALIPVLVVIITTLSGLWFTGLRSFGDTAQLSGIRYISAVVGEADTFSVLMWAAFLGGFTAIILSISQRILTLNEAILAWVSGVKAMVLAGIILTLAWAIGNICTDVQTAEYVIQLTRDILSPHLLPLISFLIAGVIAFATGTSWGTMAILAPIVIPLAYQLPLQDSSISSATSYQIFLSAIASILAGSTFGDHCSPISDTTIMSSMASGSDHIDHVRTQLPYALTVAGISIVFGYLPFGFGWNNWITLLLGFTCIYLIIRFLGKKSI